MAADIITLNVGGHIYMTTLATLTKYPDSMLGAMFSGRYTPSAKDKDGNYFIDREGKQFRYILNFLRSSKLSLPDDFKDFELLMDEAQFFEIDDLIQALKEYNSGPVQDHIEINLTTINESNVRWGFWGCNEVLRQIPQICDYMGLDTETAPDRDDRRTRPNIDRAQLFQELHQQGFCLQHTSLNFQTQSNQYLSMPHMRDTHVEKIRWIYTRVMR